MYTTIRASLVALAFLGTFTAQAQEPIPEGLRDWQGWVLRGQEFRRCPFASNAGASPDAPIERSAYRCSWPERLQLTVDARGGSFTQRWQVFAPEWVYLPGDQEFWPRDVRLNGAAAAVVEANGRPAVRVTPGSYTLSGRFEWTARPEALQLPVSTALIDLVVDGQRIAQPERPRGAVWLGKRRSAEQPPAMEVQVYRVLRDEIPGMLTTRIRLNVAGDGREEVLARVLPDGFVPLTLTGALPARLERDGTLRVQVRAGSHELTLDARATNVVREVARPPVGELAWAKEEIWSFEANDLLRVAAAEGADGIDPAQANVPAEWRQWPAFRMGADSKLNVVERGRGLANADDNRLELRRHLWLDFDHDGYTAVDNISGTLRRDWRLDMRAPFTLASAQQNGDQLLVTEGSEGRVGVELRQPQLNLTAIARKNSGSGAMPATGWEGRFERVGGTLHLPPGHRLIAAPGTDLAQGSWWENWGLWNVFGIALVVVFVYWTAGLVPAGVAALALLLTYQERPEFIWLWGNLLAALAVARSAPDGRFKRIASIYRTLSFAVLGLALLPFLWTQVRYALYPQLEPSLVAPSQYGGDDAYGLLGNMATEAAPPPMPAIVPQTNNIELNAVDAAAPAVGAELEEDAAAAGDERPQEARKTFARDKFDGSSVSGLNSAGVVQRYAAGTALQAGPGIPAWRYHSYDYHWTGPVEAADTVRFIYVGPLVMFFWRIAGIVALGALFGWLAWLSFGDRWRRKGGEGEVMAQSGESPAATSAAWAPLALVLLGALSAAAPVQAQGVPNQQTLDELKRRLTTAPPCTPSCAEILDARVNVEGDRLEIALQVSALANVAVPVPHASDRWQLEEVTVDARAALAVARDGDAALWVPLAPGAHTLRLAGRLSPAESIQVNFPRTPRAIAVTARGWTANGVNEGRLVTGSLELVRERSAQRAGAVFEAGSEFPAFVRVERVFNLDLDWTVSTRVWRVAPERAAVSLDVPLVPGESVLTSGVEVRNGNVLVGLGQGEPSTRWQSGLARAEKLELEMPASAARTEVWNFLVNPQWNVAFEGFPAVLPEDVNAPMWVFRFMPRPGEKLALTITRPAAASGTTLAIDSVALDVSVGKRSSSSKLNFTYRSTQGGRHVIKVPVEARVTSVSMDGQPQQLRPEKGELPLSLAPGSHQFEIQWEESTDVGFTTHPAGVDLNSPASNITTRVALPESRWPLFAFGAGVGPAVLYWGELIVFIAVAWLLGRWAKSPLRFFEWLLLGLGLSTQSWFVFAFVAAWLIVMRWREHWQPAPDASTFRFNATQVVLAVFTVFAVALLVFSGIRNGLLSAPDMGVRGQWGAIFAWFQDQAPGVIETPTIYSAPMWVYRTLFFAWAGWMAFALVGWLRWAFNAWKTGGLWKSESAGS
jgi:hypothetical protein